jgi:hypothetical protein
MINRKKYSSRSVVGERHDGKRMTKVVASMCDGSAADHGQIQMDTIIEDLPRELIYRRHADAHCAMPDREMRNR